MGEQLKKNINVLYHADEDGIASAYAAWLVFQDNADYIKVQYGSPFPFSLENLTKEHEIYILDFSYDRQTLLEVDSRVKKLLVLDHHTTSENILDGLEFAKFDLSAAGCIMTWKYFHPNKPIPMALLLTQDYDMWRFQYATTNEFIFGLNADSRMYDLTYWHELCNNVDSLNSLIETGHILKKDMQNKVNSFVQSKSRWQLVEYRGYRAALYNTTVALPERNAMADALNRHPELNIELTISYRFDANGGLILSFRSCRYYIDVAKFAEEFGGGGRQATAGARLPFEKGIKFLQQFNY